MIAAAKLTLFALLTSSVLGSSDAAAPAVWTAAQASDWQARSAAAAKTLEAALRDATGLDPAIEVAIGQLGATSRTAARLALALGADEPDQTRACERVISDLRFRPTLEADVPKDFPSPAPVGEVVLKEYPTYRMARTPMAKNTGQPFWRLFQHIKSNDIAMTAPVQMDFDSERRVSSMAFLYSDQLLGKPGMQGEVEVIDVAAMTAISIGARGYESEKSREELRAAHHGLQLADDSRRAPLL
jgi:hypothetical protein